MTPHFPLPKRAERGDVIPVRITAVGPDATRALPALIEAIAHGGARQGLGPDHVKFEVLPPTFRESNASELRPCDLPFTPGCAPGHLPSAEIELTTPLFMVRRGEDGRRLSATAPQLEDLARAAIRTVRRLLAFYGITTQLEHEALIGCAGLATLADNEFERFAQERWSSRQGQRYDAIGITGRGTYSNVPLALLPWIVWGGRLQVGTHRVAGAGAWKVHLS